MDPVNLRDFIFPMLFLKLISDTWDEDQAEAETEWKDDLTPRIAADWHTFVIPDGCHWEDLRHVTENHGIAVQEITQQIEQANPKRLSGIFGNAHWADHNRMPPERLHRLIEHFNRHSISPNHVPGDLLGAGYEYLLKQFSDENAANAGQFFTPRAIIHLLIKILAPKKTDHIYDPACGSGGMLIEAAQEIKSQGKPIDQMRFFGQEVNQTSSAIARMNLYIHNIQTAKILRGDTLRNPSFIDDKGKLLQFDVVIANPPFSLKSWGQENWADDPHGRSEYGVPPKNNADFAWIQHMLASAKSKTGRVGVVMPHGVLFRSGAEGRIRQRILESDYLETIIGLGQNLFYGTTIPACLWILRKQKADKWRGKVRIIDGSARYKPGRNQNLLDEGDVSALFEAYTDPTATLDKIKQVVIDVREIESNDWDLNIPRYIPLEAPEVVDVSEALVDLRQAQKHLAETQIAMDERLKAAGYA